MLTLDGKPKQFCVGCGGPRDPEYAKTVACFCCGSLGTQKTQPQFDELGERIEPKPKVVVERAAVEPEGPSRQERLQQAAARMALLFI